MGIQERKTIIRRIEEMLGAHVLTLVTGDRQGMETKIAPDILPLISDHLSHIGQAERLALFLYTPGGDSTAGWGIVNLLRQYCSKLMVLVPFRALSCGTLIALGADQIMMGKHGLLSPVDPSVASPFNPLAPGGEQLGRLNLLPVSVEDVNGFLDLARKEVGLRSDESLAHVLRILADKVHPLALGAVYRAREHTSALATRLLSKHLKDQGRVERIVAKLTRELPTHSYLIGREEAIQYVELHVVEPPPEIEAASWALYKEYETWLRLTTPASPELDLGGEERKSVRYERAAVESLVDNRLFRHVFRTDKALFKVKVSQPGIQAPIDQTMEQIIYQGWVPEIDGEAGHDE